MAVSRSVSAITKRREKIIAEERKMSMGTKPHFIVEEWRCGISGILPHRHFKIAFAHEKAVSRCGDLHKT